SPVGSPLLLPLLFLLPLPLRTDPLLPLPLLPASSSSRHPPPRRGHPPHNNNNDEQRRPAPRLYRVDRVVCERD
ncbi:hypothetical protein B0H13DRAFT_2021091, partial [Mycena leptocephala]